MKSYIVSDQSCAPHIDTTHSNKLSRDGAHHLSVLLCVNTPLTHLDISNNRIEDEGLVYLCQALATTNTNLKWYAYLV